MCIITTKWRIPNEKTREHMMINKTHSLFVDDLNVYQESPKGRKSNYCAGQPRYRRLLLGNKMCRNCVSTWQDGKMKRATSTGGTNEHN